MPDEPTTPPAAPPPLPPVATTPSRRRPLALIALGAVALGVAGGGAAAVALTGGGEPARLAVAAAAEDETTTTPEDGAVPEGACTERGEHRRPGAHGTVTGIDGTTVTIEDDEGTATTVTTDDETTVLDVAEGAVADIAEGDNVLVMAEPGADDAVTAHRVVDLGTLDPDALHPGGAERPEPPAGAEDDGATRRFGPTVGTVAAVDGASITVTTDEGDVVVTTTDATSVTVVTEIAVSDLAEGDTIAARGEAAEDGTVAAEAIVRGDLEAGPLGFGPGPGGPGGPRGWGHDGERPPG